ncbi:acetoacetate--CoA ligase [Geodermatophilus sp. SYSU D00965]
MTSTATTSSSSAPRAHKTQLASFRDLCEQRAGRSLADPAELHAFSVEEPETFWHAFLEWSQLPWSGLATPVLVGDDVETARFFPDVTLNYAEALLRPLPDVDDDAPALISVHADRPAETLSRRELRDAVATTATALAAAGIVAGSRVVAVAPNDARTTVAVLAATALGAVVATAAPDVGTAALLGRFEQVEPVLVLLDRAGLQDGPEAGTTGLLVGLPTVRQVVVLDELPLPAACAVPVARLTDLVADVRDTPRAEWPRLPFDHPLFVMFSSGTTGPPKAIVHGAGGALLEHTKEHRLHGDLHPQDRLFFHTTTAWMMWNWQLSALAVGASVVLHDGPVLGPKTLWELVSQHDVTVFGTSPAYLQLCQDAGYRPGRAVALSRLRSVLSTGAVLHDWQFDWLAEAVGPQPLQSISGGTDILGCFVLGHPELPVRPGRCQTRSLGLDVAAVDEDGEELVGRIGELVCRRPFPSRPIGFLRDPDGSRFHRAYFAQHPGTWTHGDLVEFAPDGTARMHGRSDGVLNVNGVRIGPSEVYTALRGVPEVADAMAVEQRDPAGSGRSRMVLLVVTRAGAVLDGDLDRTIRRTLRREASAAHVPSLVAAVPELPVTHNGKRSERAARDAVNGDPVANESALRNPGCLAAIRTAVLTAIPEPATAEDAPESAPAGTGSPAPVQDGVVPPGALLRIWQDVLGVPDARPDDDFMDLGGSSRQVMSLLRRLKLELGADVPITAFYADATLRSLARAVAAARTAQAPCGRLLRAGAGRPVFIACDAWGQLNELHGLVQALETTRPVYGLQPSLVDDDGRRRSIEELVADTADQVLQVQAGGPYGLVGYSFGGLLVYETACRLAAAGHEVRFLGLIDVIPPMASMTPRELVGRRWAGRLDTVSSRKRLSEQLRMRFGIGDPDPEAEAWGESYRTFNAHRLSAYAGPVTYYLAERRLPVVGNTLTAWRRSAPHLLVTEVPADHEHLLAQPHVVELAARLSATLQ